MLCCTLGLERIIPFAVHSIVTYEDFFDWDEGDKLANRMKSTSSGG